ncbi:MAG: DUF2934 domain-containing protein [Methylobacter sp.]|jgi:hypothetical protein|nr:DUF2934 domain-containing protein [Methylobacter sp.]
MSSSVHEVNVIPEESITPINLPDCYTKIAEIAFYKAEIRGFEPGHELDDWIEAELEFKEMVAKNTHP